MMVIVVELLDFVMCQCPFSPGPDYVEVLEYSTYVDEGATAYDALDGFLEPTVTYRICTLSKRLQSMLEQGLQPYVSDYSYSSFDLSQLSCYKNVSSVVVNRPGNSSVVRNND
jgi:hypothetical protein